MMQPLLSSLLSQVQAAEDLRRPLWGTLEALQAVARCLTHPREALMLACQVNHAKVQTCEDCGAFRCAAQGDEWHLPPLVKWLTDALTAAQPQGKE